jgi:hypothetical protein
MEYCKHSSPLTVAGMGPAPRKAPRRGRMYAGRGLNKINERGKADLCKQITTELRLPWQTCCSIAALLRPAVAQMSRSREMQFL